MQVLKGGVSNLVLISLWTFILLGGFFLAPAGATNSATSKVVKEICPGEAMDFDTCARIAIRQSPFLTKSDLEIQIRHLDEKDSKSDFLPSFNFRTRYYLYYYFSGRSKLHPDIPWILFPSLIARWKPIFLCRSAR